MKSVDSKICGQIISHNLERFIGILDTAGFEASAEELVDVLWLAQRISALKTGGKKTAPPAAPGDEPPAVREETAKPPDSVKTASKARDASESKAELHTRVRPHSKRTKTQAGGARHFRAPAASMLPAALRLGRALRPLMRRAPSRILKTLDEPGTVQRIAEQDIWLPIFRPKPERWLEVTLLQDAYSTMIIWEPVIAELKRLLEYCGAFRGVRLMRLKAGENPLLPRLADESGERLYHYSELSGSGGRHLILLLSDCMAPYWRDNRILLDRLSRWGRHNSLALVHMLPQRLWARSGLGEMRRINLHAARPGSPNPCLHADEPDLPAGLKLPIATLEPESVGVLAELLAGRSSAWISGAVLTRQQADDGEAPPEEAPDGVERWESFFASSSPEAQQLALRFSSVPLTFQIMRLVQQVMQRESGLVHLAEVFLSGLLARADSDRDEKDRESDPLKIPFDFVSNVRELLLESQPSSEVLHTRRVATAIEQSLGKISDFPALLVDPTADGELPLQAGSLPFARIRVKVLRRLGGTYTEMAAKLEQNIAEIEKGEEGEEGEQEQTPPSQEIKPFRDFLADNTPGSVMRPLPGGTFMMGDGEFSPIHQVTLSEFSIGQYPVTFEEYDLFCQATGREKPEDRGRGREKISVIHVSWKDAAAYCEWLSEQTGQAYRLLTEAEWEYACRAGSDAAYCFGDDESRLAEYAWYGEDWEKGGAHPVGEKEPNAFGLHDMHGNLWEWVQDWDGEYPKEAQTDPGGPETGSDRVSRGGSWFNSAVRCRSAFRGGNNPGYRDRYLGFRLARTCPLPPFTLPEMVRLPPGRFRMGDIQGNGESRERPVHDVTLDGFEIGKYPVTVREFRGFIEESGYRTEAETGHGAWTAEGKKKDANWRTPYLEQDESHPVVCISWNDARAYCEWLQKRTGEDYRLPTEAEWEYACRAGSETAYFFGDDKKLLGDYAWHWENSEGKTHPVREKKPNAWGLHDVYGNVLEWVHDWYGPSPKEAQTNPKGPETGSYQVRRGGAWSYAAVRCRSAYRSRDDPGARGRYLGFRLARTYPLPPFTLPEMVRIPEGTFKMGSGQGVGYDDERPAHEVTLDSFSIARYSVTFAEYDQFCEATGREKPGDEGWGREKRPAVNVSWEDVAAYCDWLNERSGHEYRLLTEAEWEYACRAGSETAYFFGDDEKMLGDYAWYEANSERKTHPVGEKKANAWGLHELSGNVWEWVHDWFGDYPKEAQTNPRGPDTGSSRVGRGGSWDDDAVVCRSACRGGDDPQHPRPLPGLPSGEDSPSAL
ncbi:MAG: SUMF1/EgtB/PvdO family nonheme iron enzyme [Gammaproteobacteria bacterium]|nr:SUMF1/EgtB/PvdO family nonheme iron enzyme [Gammaproteobacteria bacterium]